MLIVASVQISITYSDVDSVMAIQWPARSRPRLEQHGASMDWISTFLEVRMPFTAICGGTALADETELEAHLASLLRLENIGLLLGAGASVAAGGLTMIALWTRFVTECPEDATWMVEHGFIREDATTLPRPATPNFEHLIDSL